MGDLADQTTPRPDTNRSVENIRGANKLDNLQLGQGTQGQGRGRPLTPASAGGYSNPIDSRRAGSS